MVSEILKHYTQTLLDLRSTTAIVGGKEAALIKRWLEEHHLDPDVLKKSVVLWVKDDDFGKTTAWSLTAMHSNLQKLIAEVTKVERQMAIPRNTMPRLKAVIAREEAERNAERPTD